ncbi:MAG: class I SAM-dependent methyltransferase [Actinobacteria bacterium]|nr:class I SAM-dependent methyltransferase [Actinomycetota bacterium]
MSGPTLPHLGEGLEPTLREDLAAVTELVPLDEGGGATALKVFLLAELILNRDLSRIVEIGVYRGRLFLPLARLMFWLQRGEMVGIDPWSAEAAVQHEAALPGIDLVEWPATIDWAGMHADVQRHIERLGIGERARLIPQRSEDVDLAAEFGDAPIDLLHIDGNHDREAVRQDLDRFLPYMREGSILVMDDIGWPSVRNIYEEVATEHQVLFRITEGSVLLTPTSGGNDFAVLELRPKSTGRT